LHINTANDPPRNFRYASICPRLDHLVSGRSPVTPCTCIHRPSSKLRACWFPFGSPIKWLASPLCCTPWPVLQNVRQNIGNLPRTATSRLFPSEGRSFNALSLHHRLISGSFRLPSQGAFQLSITLLLRYRSQVMFSLGGKCPPIPARYPTHGTQELATSTPSDHGTITLYGPTFQLS
jgi:hypothetical protein